MNLFTLVRSLKMSEHPHFYGNLILANYLLLDSWNTKLVFWDNPDRVVESSSTGRLLILRLLTNANNQVKTVGIFWGKRPKIDIMKKPLLDISWFHALLSAWLTVIECIFRWNSMVMFSAHWICYFSPTCRNVLWHWV